MDLKDYAIYLDLDGVLADYGGGMSALGYEIDPEIKKDLNRSGAGHPLKREMYERIKGTDFYRTLSLMPGALDLYAACAEAEPIILTAAPKFGATEDDFHVNPFWQGAAYHKRAWVEQTLMPHATSALPVSDGASWRVPIPDDRFICTTSARKHEFMHRRHGPRQVLIDDRIANVRAWADSGGVGILHVGTETSIKVLAIVAEYPMQRLRGGLLFDGMHFG